MKNHKTSRCGLDHGTAPGSASARASKMAQEGTFDLGSSRWCGVFQVNKDDAGSCSWSRQGNQPG